MQKHTTEEIIDVFFLIFLMGGVERKCFKNEKRIITICVQ